MLAKGEFQIPKRGDKVMGVVTEVSKKMVLVDIGAKTEGMVVDKEFEIAEDLIENLKIGDRVEAYVVSPENDRGQILLSFKGAAQAYSWDKFKQFLETGEVVVVRGLELNKGGMVVKTDGMRGFIPTSQFGKKWTGNLEDLLNKAVKVKLIEVDQDKNRLIFSERQVSEADQIAQRNAALDLIQEGEVLEGVISGVMPFGVFVTVQVRSPKAQKRTESIEIEGLVHISEISWEKVDDPSKLFVVGDKIKVKVIGVDLTGGRLNLSIKRLVDDPWQKVLVSYPIGGKHKGTVTRVEQFGVFVNLEPGIDGLIHISKIPAGEEPEVGEKIEVYVESIDPEQRRMSLSLVLKSTEKVIYK
ncbi:MAG: S1 RNA-binding domain-containing protein [Candidatus Chisholmbacteria bacterium]|nr:S1 RNA-binding domain-containing protein [Candidatus Chisholmbacteria bacterium]